MEENLDKKIILLEVFKYCDQKAIECIYENQDIFKAVVVELVNGIGLRWDDVIRRTEWKVDNAKMLSKV